MLNFCDFIQVYVFTTNHHLNVNVCCVFLLKAHHRVDSNEYTQNKKITLSYLKSAAMGFVPRDSRTISK